MNVKVISDFLPKPAFDEIQQIVFSPGFKWNFSSSVTGESTVRRNKKLFLLHHLVYEKNAYNGEDPADQQILQMLMFEGMYNARFQYYYDVMGKTLPKGQFLDIPNKEKLLRVKINFYPNTVVLEEHDYHIDYPNSNNGCLLSLNTCDGYTKIKETGKKYHSVENTLLHFDASKEHCSTTTTNAVGRFNININYTK